MSEPSRQQLLERYVERSTDPVIWGVDDCSMWPAQWIRIVKPKVVLALPSYGSEAEAQAIIDSAGGLVNVWDEMADAARPRIFRTNENAPAYGDVGIVRMRGREFGVVFAADKVALWRNDKGRVLMLRPPEVAAAWAI